MAAAKIQLIAIEKDGCRDGTYGWEVWVNDVCVIEEIRDLDLANSNLNPIWKALNINLEFDWD